MTNFDDATAALSGDRWNITDAPRHVPAVPGLYAIYGDEDAWRGLGLDRSQNHRSTSARQRSHSHAANCRVTSR